MRSFGFVLLISPQGSCLLLVEQERLDSVRHLIERAVQARLELGAGRQRQQRQRRGQAVRLRGRAGSTSGFRLALGLLNTYRLLPKGHQRGPARCALERLDRLMKLAHRHRLRDGVFHIGSRVPETIGDMCQSN
jgi:hypothetical protein